MFQLNNRFRDVTFALLIAISGALITACGGGGGDSGPQTGDDPQTGDTTPVQVGTNTRTIAELTGDTFITPLPIFSSGSETETLASGWRYYPWDNYDEFTGFIYQAGGNQLWDFDINDDSEGPSHIFTEYRLVGRDETAFSTDTGMLAFAGYDYWEDGDTALDDAEAFALEGKYAAAINWYSNNDGLRGTVGLATPVGTEVPNSGYAVYRGKALGGFVIGTPEDRTDIYSRPRRGGPNNLRGGDTGEMRYFVEGDTARVVDFAEEEWSSYFALRAYEETGTDGRAHWNYLFGDRTATATATVPGDVVGTLFVEIDGDFSSDRNGLISLYPFEDPELLLDEIFGTGMFSHLASELSSPNYRAMSAFYDLGFYGPNREETAGDLRLSACGETPSYDGDGHFESCGGTLHYLGVGFVEQKAVLPQPTTANTPAQGDTQADVLSKLNLTGAETEDGPFGEGTETEYENYLEYGTAAEIVSYDYASYGYWERLVMDEDGTITPQFGYLYFETNRVKTLPTTGTATYNLALNITRSDDWDEYRYSPNGGSLMANFATDDIDGNFVITPSSDHPDDSITMTFTNGEINNDATFSGGLSVSNPTGIFADVTTGANGKFQGTFYDSATDGRTPAEVAGTLDDVMDSNENEWTGGFIGRDRNNPLTNN